jgi:soluble lytic murein transglycosylase-like protein
MRAMRGIVAGVAALLLSACATLRPAPPEIASLPAPSAAEPEAEQPSEDPRDLQLACLPEKSIDAWEQRLRAKRQHYEDHLEHPRRGGRYLEDVQRQIDEAGLPPEVAYLPTIESGYRSDVRGIGGRGLWQLGESTARRYGLVVSGARDDRTNPHLSTQVAIRHLQYLYGRYGDWPLALAAYNAGEGRVDRALRLDPGASFWDLAERGRLPPVTCTYVPKLLGLVRVVYPDECEDESIDAVALDEL